MNKKQQKILIGSLSSIAVLGMVAAGVIYYYFFSNLLQMNQSTYIYIDRDDTVDSVYCKIEKAGNPKSMAGFRYLAQQGNYASRILTGKYELKPEDNMRYLYRRLSLGYQTPVRLTINSVRTLDRLAKSVGNQLMIDSAEVAHLINDSSYYTTLGYSKETLPALFIPNTYEVYWNLSADKFMKRMVKEHQAFWNEKRKARAEKIGLTPVEVATLASIVDEETAVNAEKPMVAGLYINRLKRGMLLQADPTVKFSLQEFTLRRILYKHLEVDSPYNTYKYAGLPPGPIRVPSIQGLESVLNYTPHSYLYMCAKEDFSGTHNFARTSAQHHANARRYQQALNRLKIR